MSKSAEFVDIMEPRWAETSIFPFMTRAFRPKKTMELDKTFTPQDLKDMTAKSGFMDAIIEAESAATGVSKEKLKLEVLKYLEEMGLDRKMYVIRWMGVVFLKISFMMKIGVFVNDSAICSFKSAMGKNPVLFLPTHRSYADFCLMTYLCYHYDIELPAVAAGMDFYSMAIVGRSMRDTCAFYIRRTLAGAPLYAATLRQYVRTVVAKHAAPFEFFIEGTRSRSNKCLPPKYGMLSMALAPLFTGEVSDVTIVPINISYDRLMEHGLFAYEHLGVPKPKESTGGLLKAVFRLNDHFGNIYINFGKPMQVKEYLNNDLSQNNELLKPIELQQVSERQFGLVQNIAHDVVAAQQDSTVVTITNLVSLVLMQSILKNKPLLYEEVLQEIESLIQMLRRLGATVFENNVKASVDKILIVHKQMIRIDKGKLKLISSVPMTISEDVKAKMKGHTLQAETMVNAVPIIQLQLYVNPVLHYLVPPAVVSLIVARGLVSREKLKADYHRVRRLLKHEFFFVDKAEEATLEKAIQFSVENDVIRLQEDHFVCGNNKELSYTLRWAAAPALSTLLVCCDVMREKQSYTHKEALKFVQERVESSGSHPYCLSLEAANNCLQGLVVSGALAKGKISDQQSYTATASIEECRALVSSIMPQINADFGRGNSVILDQRFPARL